MWALIKSLLAKWAIFRAILKAIGGLAWLIPIAFVLKAIGVPMLMLLLVLAAPVLIVLAVVGLPIIVVLGLGGVLLALLFAIVSVGIAALKIALPIVLIVWVVNWLLRKRSPDEPPPAAPLSDAPDAPPA